MVQGKSVGLAPHFDAPVAMKICGTCLAFMYLMMAELVGVPIVPTMASTLSSSTILRCCSTVRGGL